MGRRACGYDDNGVSVGYVKRADTDSRGSERYDRVDRDCRAEDGADADGRSVEHGRLDHTGSDEGTANRARRPSHELLHGTVSLRRQNVPPGSAQDENGLPHEGALVVHAVVRARSRIAGFDDIPDEPDSDRGGEVRRV